MEDNELHIACLDSRPLRAVFRYAALLVGCLATGVAFCVDLFAAYGETLKETFGFSQEQLGLIVSMANLGLVSALPVGILVQKYDTRWLSGGAFVTSTISSALILGSTYHIEFYSQYFYALGIFYFILGCSGGAMYIIALHVNIHNFSRGRSGTVSGIMHAMRSVVLCAMLIVYHVIFKKPYINTDKPVPTTSGNVTTTRAPLPDISLNIDLLQEYFMFMLMVYAAVNFLACMFYGDYRDLSPEEPEPEVNVVSDQELLPIRTTGPVHPDASIQESVITNSVNSTNTEDGLASSSTVNLIEEETTRIRTYICVLLKQSRFHLLLWPSVFMVAMRNVYISNFSVLLTSFNLEHASLYIYTIPVVGVVGSVLLGLLADAISHRFPRSGFYMISACFMTAFFLFDMGFEGQLALLVLSLIWTQLAASCVLSLGPSLQLKHFPSESFSAGWGIITLLTTVLTFLLQLLFGFLYDSFTRKGDLVCYGFMCYILYFFISAIFSYGCCVCLFFLLRYELENRSS